jgi:hypothetical protein
MILFVMISSCQKDPVEKDTNPEKTNLNADSANVSSIVNAPGNYLAATGILTIKIKDSIYIFDASKDSIAFVNVHIDENNQYFGITAINKEHTMSFGISSAGSVNNNISSGIAGSQLLLNQDENKAGLQYSLSRYAGQKDFGTINIIQYNQQNELAKGTFFTFLAKDDKANSPFYKVEGSFDLQLK